MSTLLISTTSAFAAADPHSYAEPEKIVTQHIDLNLNVDLEKKTIGGSVVLTLDRQDKSATLVLDTKDLQISSIQLLSGKKNIDLKYTFGVPDPVLGQKLEITFPQSAKSSKVKITYTASNASGLMWNTPEQTISKRPFMTSNNEPIGARTWIPCQDTPVVRASYNATVNVAQKDLMAVMSATNPTKLNAKGEYRFAMEIPVPSYLIALAVGKLEFKETGPRTGVYAEPEMLTAAADEFSETEKQLAAAEKLYGKYVWGRYDLLVLPANFPWGGMENPRLTFVTPTLITGKKDLVDVIAHEIAHSWSGNLVTNAQWSDVWINEGFTTYVQYRIIEQLHGVEVRMRDMALDKAGLENDLKDPELPSADTRLKTDFKGRNPEDVFTQVPYVKGALLLYTIEQKIGKPRFDAFLKSYFANHTFKSITTDEVVAELSKITDKSLVDEWINKPGIPESVAPIKSTIVENIDAMTKSFKLLGAVPAKKDLEKMTSKDICYFLQSILSLSPSKYKLDALNRAFDFSSTKDPEVKTLWYRVSLKKNYESSMRSAPDFLSTVGRGKFVVPVYDALLETKQGRKVARDTFDRNKGFYSPMVEARVEKKLQSK